MHIVLRRRQLKCFDFTPGSCVFCEAAFVGHKSIFCWMLSRYPVLILRPYMCTYQGIREVFQRGRLPETLISNKLISNKLIWLCQGQATVKLRLMIREKH